MFWVELFLDNSVTINNCIDKNLFNFSLLFTKTQSKNPGRHLEAGLVQSLTQNKTQVSEPES